MSVICVHVSHTVIRDFPKVVSGIQKGGWKLSLHLLLILPTLCTNPRPPALIPCTRLRLSCPLRLLSTCCLCTCCGHCVSSMPELSGETWLEHRALGRTRDCLACSQVLGRLLEKMTAKVGPAGLRGTLEQEINGDRGIEKLG